MVSLGRLRQTARLALFLGGLISTLFLACSGDRHGSPAPPSPPEERLFFLDETGLYEITAGTHALIASPPDRGFIFDAAVSREADQVALSIQDDPKQTANGYDFGVDLYVGRGGQAPRPLVVHKRIGESMTRPNWLPGGNQIIFSVFGRSESGGADLHIETVDVDSGARDRLIDNAVEPSLSPDAGTLAYVAIDQTTGNDVIMLRDMATGESRPLLASNIVMANVGNIAWTWDGSRLAFAAADPISLSLPPRGMPLAAMHPSLRDVWVVNIDGTDLRRRSELADGTLALAWALDDAHIYAVGDTGFWRIPADGGDPEKLGGPVLTGRVQTLVR
jgi:hypothetical protein